MIEGLVGLMGQGKTLWAVERMVRQARQGRRCMANFHCRTAIKAGRPIWEFGLFADMQLAENCYCVIDEAQMWFGSRAFKDTSQSELSYFQQSRKEGVDVLWIAQHQARVDVAVREVTSYIWKTKKVGSWLLLRKFQEAEPKVVLERRFWKVNPALFRHYWTEQRIGNRAGDGYGFGRSTTYGNDAELIRINGRMALRPNYARVISPHGSSWVYMDRPEFRDCLQAAVDQWRLVGSPRPAAACVECFYRGRDGGFCRVLDDGGFDLREYSALDDLLGYVVPASMLAPSGSAAGAACPPAAAGRRLL